MNHYQMNQYQNTGGDGSGAPQGQQQQQPQGATNVQQFVIGLNGGYHQYDPGQQQQLNHVQDPNASGTLGLEDGFGSQVQVGGDSYTLYQVQYTDQVGSSLGGLNQQLSPYDHATSTINLQDWNKSLVEQQQQQQQQSQHSPQPQQNAQQAPTILQWNNHGQPAQYQLAGMHHAGGQHVTMNQVQLMSPQANQQQQQVPTTVEMYTIQTGQNGQTQLVPAVAYRQAQAAAAAAQQGLVSPQGSNLNVITIKSGETIQLQQQQQVPTVQKPVVQPVQRKLACFFVIVFYLFIFKGFFFYC